jgi:hypothetical protein
MMQLDKELYKECISRDKVVSNDRFTDMKESIKKIKKLIDSNIAHINSLHNYRKHQICFVCNVALNAPEFPTSVHKARKQTCIISNNVTRKTCAIKIQKSLLHKIQRSPEAPCIVKEGEGYYIFTNQRYTTFVQCVWFIGHFKALVSEFIQKHFTSKASKLYKTPCIHTCTRLIGEFILSLKKHEDDAIKRITDKLIKTHRHINHSIEIYIETCEKESKSRNDILSFAGD